MPGFALASFLPVLGSILNFDKLTSLFFPGLKNQALEGIDLGDALKVGVGQDTTVKSLYSTPAQMVNIIVTAIFIVAGIMLFVMIFYSGFLFLQDSSKGIEEARKVWINAAIGFITMFVAYWVVQIVEIVIGMPILF